ncbi:MAG TPA: FG-GAP-like repeat-containing protein, partial [Tepidisphaeraceae bacterium]|nr:FG-GAP-like repeat-containing protein [Tepidisphaeraceae bacterium]
MGSYLPCARLGGFLLLAFGGLTGCKKKPAAPTPVPVVAVISEASLVDQNNLGVGLMGRFDFEGAAKVFQSLVEGHKDRPGVQMNLAIAILNRQREGDSALAMREIDRVLAVAPDDLRAVYCKGLLELNGGNSAAALEDFRRMKAVDRDDAFAAYYLGQCWSARGNPSAALGEYERAIQLDPLLRSAYYGAFQSLQQLGEAPEAKDRLGEFTKLADNPRAKLAEFKYTRMGIKAMAVVMDAPDQKPAPAPSGPAFAAGAPLRVVNGKGLVWRSASEVGPKPTITVADIDGDGRLDLFITSALKVDGALRNAVLLARPGGFEVALDHPLAAVADVNAAVWGDFDNDGLLDVYLCRHGPNQLWRQTKPGQWRDITASAHASGGNFNTVDGVAVDADHDGDLDLFLVRSDGPSELLNNNLDGTFRPIGAKAGISGDGRPAVGVVAADLNHDGLVDFLVIKRKPPHEVFLNRSLWKFEADGHFKELLNAPISAAVAIDAEANGQASLFAASQGRLARWSPDGDGVWRKLDGRASGSEAQMISGPLAVADIDGSGSWEIVHGMGNTGASGSSGPA